jgi:TatD DNase family protein
MKLIDTHTHLYVEEFKDDIDTVVARAMEEGVEKFYLPAIDSSETGALLDLERRFPGKMYAMSGLHPCSVKENFKEELQKIEQQLSEREFAAIGETGLDFYWDTSFKKEQIESLHVHAEWAIKYKKPLVIHTRKSMSETIELVKEYKSRNLYGIFHCFSGTSKDATEIIDAGFFLGIGGVLTFKNSGLAGVIKDVDLKYLVLETDSPYLAPVPFRGKRN